MVSIGRNVHGKLFAAILGVALGVSSLAAHGKAMSSGMSSPASAAPPMATFGGNQQPRVPKVPFGNRPCQALSAANLQSLGLADSAPGKADRAPATLPVDNLCFVGEVHYGFMTQEDYEFNRDGNRSTSHSAPADLPGSFWDRQGGLWFAKNGYFVVVAGSHAVDEQVARIIAGKL